MIASCLVPLSEADLYPPAMGATLALLFERSVDPFGDLLRMTIRILGDIALEEHGRRDIDHHRIGIVEGKVGHARSAVGVTWNTEHNAVRTDERRGCRRASATPVEAPE